MNIIAVSDLHSDASAIVRLAPQLAEAGLVLVAGDITNFGGRREAAAILDRLEKHAKRILAVPGNCDRPEVGAYLSERGWNLDGRAAEIEGLWLIGLGGSLPCPGHTLLEYSEDELKETLDTAHQEIPLGNPFLLLCHQPPHGTKVDRVLGGLHVGSRSIRNFIEDKKPLACLCGHIHESPGLDAVGTTKVANPGPMSRGGFIRADWDGKVLRVEIRSIK